MVSDSHDSTDASQQRSEAPSPQRLPAEGAVPVHTFQQLAQGGKEVVIQHRGQVYRLRATRNGGLILNK